MRKTIGLVLLTLLIVVAGARGQAQGGCEDGIVRLPAGVSGAITICPAVASQAPDMARNLAQIRTAMSSEQAQLAQLTRLVKDINQVSGPLDARRQAELLTNVVERLGDAHTVTGVQLGRRADMLSGHFEDVATQISTAQGNPSEAAKTQTALQGQVGDAIARLDFDTVSNQLSDIQSTVHSVDERTKQIQGTLDSIRDAQQQSQQAQEEGMQNMQARLLADPNRFLMLHFNVMGGQVGGHVKVMLGLTHLGGEALTEAKMQIVFTMAGERPWTISPPIPRFIENMTTSMIDVPRIGDHAVMCVSAVDPRNNERRRYRKAFVVTAQGYGLQFQPDSEATLTADSDTPCQ